MAVNSEATWQSSFSATMLASTSMKFGSTTRSSSAFEQLKKRQAEQVALSPRKLQKVEALRAGSRFTPESGYLVRDHEVSVTFTAASPVKATVVALEDARREVKEFKAATALREVAYKFSFVAQQYIYLPGEDTGSQRPLSLGTLRWRARQTHKLKVLPGWEPEYKTDVFTPGQLQRWLEIKAFAEHHMGLNIDDILGVDSDLRQHGFGFAHAVEQAEKLTADDLHKGAVEAFQNAPSGMVSQVKRFVNLLALFSKSDHPLQPDRTFAEFKAGV